MATMWWPLLANSALVAATKQTQPLSMARSGEVVVFVDTTLGTHLAFTAQQHITAGDFKLRLGCEHFNCFPHLGEIKIRALTVKRKSYFYHLPDSMPIRIAFQGLVGPWFLFVDASMLHDMPRQEACPTYQELPSSKKFQEDNDKSSLGRLSEVMVNTSDTIDISNSENIMIYKSTEMKHLADRCITDNLMHDEDKTEVSTAKCVVIGTPKFAKVKAAHTKLEHKDVKSYSNPEERNQTKNNIIVDDSLFVAKKVENLLLGHKLARNEHSSVSTCVTPTSSRSEVKSVTGIISSFFADYAEVNSCSRQPPEDIQKFEGTAENEIIESSAYHGSPNKIERCDSDTTCSSRIIVSDKKQCQNNLTSTSYGNSEKNPIIASGTESQKIHSTRKAGKNSGILVSGYHANRATDESVMRRVNQRVVLKTPRTKSKTPSKKQMEASNHRADRCAVGKRLVQAAKNMEFSASGEKLRESMFTRKFGFLSTDKSMNVVRKCVFEIGDSDG